MKIWYYNMKTVENPNRTDWSEILKRPTQTVENIENTVNQIFDDVKRNGDIAISKYTELFDGISLASNIVTEEEISEAVNSVSKELKTAIQAVSYTHLTLPTICSV